MASRWARPVGRVLETCERFVNAWSPRIVEWFVAAVAFVHLWAGRCVRIAALGIGCIVGKVRWPLRLSFLFAVMAGAAGRVAVVGAEFLPGWSRLGAEAHAYLRQSGFLGSFRHLALFCGVSAVLCSACVVLPFVRHRFSLRFMKVGAAAFAVSWFWMLLMVVRLPGALLRADALFFDKLSRDELWLQGVSFWSAIAVVGLLGILSLMLTAVTRLYDKRDAAQPHALLGDRIVEDIRAHGNDTRWRTSTYWAVVLHLFVLCLPFIMRGGCGWQRAVPVPYGSGVQQVEVVQIQQEEQKERRWLLSEDSPFIFDRIEIDDSEVFKEVDKQTENIYVAQALQHGKLGEGGGTRGGWPHGMPGKVRFIRLQYSGGDWDMTMGRGADHNFLLKFRELTGFDVEGNTESVTVPQLRRFPKAKGPPFVYMTGGGNIQMSDHDVRTLRWYCLEEGGMIFADNGGGSFDRNFRQLMRRVFPDKTFVDIANDDPIYRHPYSFPSGAPPLWHHSGRRALGIRHQGRWIVFYHQGDMKDAWRTGHSGASEAVAMQAYKMGVNVVNYAFTRYLNFHHQ